MSPGGRPWGWGEITRGPRRPPRAGGWDIEIEHSVQRVDHLSDVRCPASARSSGRTSIHTNAQPRPGPEIAQLFTLALHAGAKR